MKIGQIKRKTREERGKRRKAEGREERKYGGK